MAKLLVTGGAGFIGANFVRFWRRRYEHDELCVLDALTYAGNRASLSSCLLYTSPSPRDGLLSRMPSSA